MLMLLNKKELEMAPNSINHTAASYHDEQTSAGISDRDIGASLLEQGLGLGVHLINIAM